jgi:hypothetical protein
MRSPLRLQNAWFTSDFPLPSARPGDRSEECFSRETADRILVNRIPSPLATPVTNLSSITEGARPFIHLLEVMNPAKSAQLHCAAPAAGDRQGASARSTPKES